MNCHLIIIPPLPHQPTLTIINEASTASIRSITQIEALQTEVVYSHV